MTFRDSVQLEFNHVYEILLKLSTSLCDGRDELNELRERVERLERDNQHNQATVQEQHQEHA